ncbi:MAG TPA: rhomboid family intramembrane serine protease [Thermoanaerobaculia bacterium]|jgi:hypothetical protein|nr:rhomboid family intramembrane serine protease [Thermoanaerobaculia bacterium]
MVRRLPWLSAAVALAGTLVALCPATAQALQYDRAGVTSGAIWLLLTSQLAHWSVRMAVFDLGAVLLLGALLEIRGARRLAALAIAGGALATAAVVQFLPPYFAFYRGASGLASALYVAAAIELAQTEAGWRRLVALAAIAGFVLKVAWEVKTGQPIAMGAFPPGVVVTPVIHAAAGLAGAAAAIYERFARPQIDSR